MKRDFLQQLGLYNPKKHYIGGWYASEKLDGQRVFWDGGLSTGLLKSEVPWANLDKDERYLEEPIATGLWTRYGNVVQAPAAWLEKLPPIPLDAELYNPRLPRQELRSIISQKVPVESDWLANVQMHTFNIIPLSEVLADGRIDLPCFSKLLYGCMDWIKTRPRVYHLSPGCAFTFVMDRMDTLIPWSDQVVKVPQIQLPFTEVDEALKAMIEPIMEKGGEGLVIQDPYTIWKPERRTREVLKYKPYRDSEAVVVGFTSGRETNKGSRLLGKIGALIVKWGEITFELSGMTDMQRELKNAYSVEWAMKNPGKEAPRDIEGLHIKRGMQIKFKYRNLSNDGVPQEASFMEVCDGN